MPVICAIVFLPNKDVYLRRMSDSDFDLAGKAYQALAWSRVGF